jgi:tetratricopeptide (TPR) repeat protein
MKFLNEKIMLITGAFILCVLTTGTAYAEHPHEVVMLEAKQNFYDAYQAFLKLSPRNRPIDALIAGGRSAWGLSLPDQARKIFTYVLKQSLTREQEGEVLLSLAVINFQEKKLDDAETAVMRVLSRFPSMHPFRGRAFYVLGEIYDHKNNSNEALTYLESAFEEAAPELIPTISYLQGRLFKKVGKFDEAQKAFERIPVSHELAGHSVRRLAKLSLENKDFAQAEFWLQKGREEHQALFLDSWVEYALMQVALSRGDVRQVEKLVQQATKKYPLSDPWLVLLNAAAEQFLSVRASLGSNNKDTEN